MLAVLYVVGIVGIKAACTLSSWDTPFEFSFWVYPCCDSSVAAKAFPDHNLQTLWCFCVQGMVLMFLYMYIHMYVCQGQRRLGLSVGLRQKSAGSKTASRQCAKNLLALKCLVSSLLQMMGRSDMQA